MKILNHRMASAAAPAGAPTITQGKLLPMEVSAPSYHGNRRANQQLLVQHYCSHSDNRLGNEDELCGQQRLSLRLTAATLHAYIQAI